MNLIRKLLGTAEPEAGEPERVKPQPPVAAAQQQAAAPAESFATSKRRESDDDEFEGEGWTFWGG